MSITGDIREILQMNIYEFQAFSTYFSQETPGIFASRSMTALAAMRPMIIQPRWGLHAPFLLQSSTLPNRGFAAPRPTS